MAVADPLCCFKGLIGIRKCCQPASVVKGCEARGLQKPRGFVDVDSLFIYRWLCCVDGEEVKVNDEL